MGNNRKIGKIYRGKMRRDYKEKGQVKIQKGLWRVLRKKDGKSGKEL